MYFNLQCGQLTSYGMLVGFLWRKMVDFRSYFLAIFSQISTKTYRTKSIASQCCMSVIFPDWQIEFRMQQRKGKEILKLRKRVELRFNLLAPKSWPIKFQKHLSNQSFLTLGCTCCHWQKISAPHFKHQVKKTLGESQIDHAYCKVSKIREGDY